MEFVKNKQDLERILNVNLELITSFVENKKESNLTVYNQVADSLNNELNTLFNNLFRLYGEKSKKDNLVDSIRTYKSTVPRNSPNMIEEYKEEMELEIGKDLYEKLTTQSREDTNMELKQQEEEVVSLRNRIYRTLESSLGQENFNGGLKKIVKEKTKEKIKIFNKLDGDFLKSNKENIDTILSLNSTNALCSLKYAQKLNLKGEDEFLYIKATNQLSKDSLKFTYNVVKDSNMRIEDINNISTMDVEYLKKKIKISEKYFSDKSIQKKILLQDIKIVERIPLAYRLFNEDVELFRNFYKEKFKAEGSSIDNLPEDKKYGSLIVKARSILNEQNTEDFLEEKKSPGNLKLPGKLRGSRSPSFGKWPSD